MKVLVDTYNQENALVGPTLSLNLRQGSFAALLVAHSIRQPGASAGTGKGKWRVLCCQFYSLERRRIGNV